MSSPKHSASSGCGSSSQCQGSDGFRRLSNMGAEAGVCLRRESKQTVSSLVTSSVTTSALLVDKKAPWSISLEILEEQPNDVDVSANLPDDVIAMVFSKLGSAKHVALASLVSKRWHAVSRRAGSLQFIHVNQPCHALEEVVSRMVLRSDGLRSLVLSASSLACSHMAAPREFIVEAWARHVAPTLEHFELAYASPSHSTIGYAEYVEWGASAGPNISRHVSHLASHCKRLRTLKLSMLSLDDSIMSRLSKFPRLEELTLEWVHLSAFALQRLVASCPSLRKLTLFMANGLPQSLELNLPTLQRLQCSYVRISNITINASPKLTSLDMRDMLLTGITVNGAPALSDVSVTSASTISLTLPQSTQVRRLHLKAGGIIWISLTKVITAARSISCFSLDLLSDSQIVCACPVEGPHTCAQQRQKVLDVDFLATHLPNLHHLSLGPIPWEHMVGRVGTELILPSSVKNWPKLISVLEIKPGARNAHCVSWIAAFLENCKQMRTLRIATSVHQVLSPQDEGTETAEVPLEETSENGFFFSILKLQNQFPSVGIALPIVFPQNMARSVST